MMEGLKNLIGITILTNDLETPEPSSGSPSGVILFLLPKGKPDLSNGFRIVEIYAEFSFIFWRLLFLP
jgi:hypothetical protein